MEFVRLDVWAALFGELICRSGAGVVPAKPLQVDALVQSGYCLDAPELIPAGSHQFEEFLDDELISCGPTFIEREAA